VRRRSVPDFPSRCSGFIFCEFFSNLGRTGCRRGRTPERPLRQPSKVWLISQTVFVSGFVDGNSAPTRLCRKAGLTHLPCDLPRLQRVQSARSLRVRRFPTAGECLGAYESSAPRSQIGIAKCCALRKVALTVESGSFPFRYQTAGSGMPGGRTQRHPICLLKSRVRLPNFAGRGLAGNVSGESGGGGTSGSLARQERESPGGEALTAVYLSHRVSAGPMTARTRYLTGALGGRTRFLR
jgi:hypothetical protein